MAKSKAAQLLDIIAQVQNAASREPESIEDSLEPDYGLPLEEHKLFYEVAALKQQLLEAIQNHGLRTSYVGKIFWVVCLWLVCVATAVYFSAFKAWNFSLSDSVLIAFITSTTVNVLGLFVVVAKWLFPNHTTTGRANTAETSRGKK